ncbi:hypothetical protein ACEZCY_16695 [Streptacidiphilus sp. N1-12]|uniref:Uncharacterized protein n=2 Tax=Streptacidiphilus alkalitolerans TaxID=3342712 RepID=A0ABV6VAG2_9ACTN
MGGALLAPLLGLALAGPATAAGATAKTPPACTTVLCTVQQAKQNTVVTEELTASKTVTDLGDLAALKRELLHHTLRVTVDHNVVTGPGGSILLDLAAEDHRFVDGSSRISTLDSDQTKQLTTLHNGCDALCGALTGTGPGQSKALPAELQGKNLLKDNQAEPIPSKPGADWLLRGGLGALLLVLLAVLALVVLRSGGIRSRRYAGPQPPGDRRSAADQEQLATTAFRLPSQAQAQAPAPAARRIPRPSELRRATIATDLHPQGYVDIDQCLYRAVWSDPDQPAPPPGGAVEVGRADPDDPAQDPEVLLAFPPDLTASPQRRLHAQ